MPLSPIDLYRDVLPGTDCGDCGFSTCLAFAAAVVSDKVALHNCPHLNSSTVQKYSDQLQEQYARGKWTKRDTAGDALRWAKERSASMRIQDLPARIGGDIVEFQGQTALRLPYFQTYIFITLDAVRYADGKDLNRWEQVFIYNHLAQGGKSLPSGTWKAFHEFPNTVSKIKSMREHVQKPLQECFSGRIGSLRQAAASLGAEEANLSFPTADAAFILHPLPRIPLLLLFWDQEADEGFQAQANILFDSTAPEHLDIESMLFLCERLRILLCEAA